MPNSLESQRRRTRAATLLEEAAAAVRVQDYGVAGHLISDAQRLLAEIKKKEGARVCMHADDDGAGSHLLSPGEECPRKQSGPRPSLNPAKARDQV